MKKLIAVLFFVLTGLAYSQNIDLFLNTNVSHDYENYLNSELAKCNQIILNPASEPEKMKSLAMRIFINFSLITCKADSFVIKGEKIADSIKSINQRADNFYKMNIKPLNTENSKLFFNSLLELFKSPKYNGLRNDVENLADDYSSQLNNLVDNSTELFDPVSEKLQQIKDDFNLIKNSKAEYTVRIKIENSGVADILTFNQMQFQEVNSIINLCDNASESFKNAANNFSSLQDGNNKSAAVITSLKNSIKYFSAGLDTLAQLLNNEPLSLFNINTSWISDTKDFLGNITDILNGEVYTFGGDNIKIHPVTILEYSFNDLGNILFDFYRTSNRYTYTFSGLFPNALPASIVDKLKEDMIINLSDNLQEMDARMLTLKKAFSSMISSGQSNSTTSFGMAITQTYFYMEDLNKELTDFVQYVMDGDFKSGFQFNVINNKALADSISRYFNSACDDNKMLFTILMINGPDSKLYNINSSTEFYPVFISNSMIINLRDMSQELIYSINDIGDSFNSFYKDVDNMFNTSLDPNYLDFSDVQSPLDFILVLEKSNPNFLDITPYGISQIKKMHSTIKDELSKYAGKINDLDNFLDSLEVYRSDYNLSEQDTRTFISDINKFIQDVNIDMQEPASTTVINNVKVNLSAWFDNPPQHLLAELKNFFDDDSTNNTLGGLFPDGLKTDIAQNRNQKITTFYLSQNYPNPFNPSTTISYSVPKTSFVSIKVYDVLGREIETLLNDEKQAGNYKVKFNAGRLSSGIYFYKMQAGDFIETKKLIVLK